MTVEDVCADVLQILAQEVFHVDDVSDQLDASLRDRSSSPQKEKQAKSPPTTIANCSVLTPSCTLVAEAYLHTTDRQLLTSHQ